MTGVVALALFLFGLLLRILFQLAVPDGGACWHLGFQGDAPIWQDLAARLAHGIADVELQLPWRPPAMTRGIAFLCGGDGPALWWTRQLFVLLGAAIAPLLWWLLRPQVAPSIAFVAALLCAAAGNLLLLSSGLHAETPYLVGVLLTMFDQRRLGERPTAAVALRWGLLHGLLCLLRAEHALVFVALSLLLPLRTRRGLLAALLALAGAAVPLVPWQLHANHQLAAWNGAPGDAAPLPPSALPWDDDALAALRAWPTFQQGPMFQFVTTTMRHRGADRVRAADLTVVREAFGVEPEPLRPQFVALHGGLDLWLANTPEADGAFSRAALDRPPPLQGGAERYAPDLRDQLPRGGKLALNYPPHLHAFVHGPSLAGRELLADPVGAARRILRKLWFAVEGATGGLGGQALPIGLSGERRPVDFVTATGIWPSVWRALVLVASALGWWQLRRIRALWPLLVFAAVRLLVVAAFFGYARQGALCLPVVAIGVAALLHRLAPSTAEGPRGRWLAAGAMLVLLAIDAVRATGTQAELDGRAWLGPAGGEADHRAHTITFR